MKEVRYLENAKIMSPARAAVFHSRQGGCRRPVARMVSASHSLSGVKASLPKATHLRHQSSDELFEFSSSTMWAPPSTKCVYP
jgi:hypothetical protein